MNFPGLVLLASAIMLADCDELGGFGDAQRFKEDFHYSYNLKPGGRLYLENTNGAVEILGWEKSSVDINGTKYSSDEAFLKAFKIDVTAAEDSVRIRAIPPSGRRANYGAKFLIRVPQNAVLEQISSSNGSIRVESVDGSARLRTSNGSIRVVRLKGALEARTSNSSIEVHEVSGGASLHSSNGSIRGDGIRGGLEAGTSNSSINLRLAASDPARPTKLETSNGGIEISVDALNSDLRASSSNGSVTVRLPESVKAHVRARTSNGSVNTNFDVQARTTSRSRSRLEGEIGGGGPLLDLTSSNGSIRIVKQI